ncbi:MAG: DUF1223 domain-containing protein [Bradymonadia bacterium]
MRTFLLVSAAALSLGILSAAITESHADASNLLPAKANSEAVAVVELYTSEGCSSCPPADAVLDAMGREARAKGLPVFPLAFHVDYWNYIGWDDPFSHKAWTQRQNQFAASRGSRRIYTPQMVVNGQREFVGSSAGKARAALSEALKSPAQVKVKIGALASQGRTVTAQYSLDTVPEGSKVLLAVTEGGLTSEIGAGENHGRTLTHGHVVRALGTDSAQSKGTIKARLPDGVDTKGLTAVIYVQHNRTWKVLGGAAQTL